MKVENPGTNERHFNGMGGGAERALFCLKVPRLRPFVLITAL
jgi:hypothetical protein